MTYIEVKECYPDIIIFDKKSNDNEKLLEIYNNTSEKELIYSSLLLTNKTKDHGYGKYSYSSYKMNDKLFIAKKIISLIYFGKKYIVITNDYGDLEEAVRLKILPRLNTEKPLVEFNNLSYQEINLMKKNNNISEIITIYILDIESNSIYIFVSEKIGYDMYSRKEIKILDGIMFRFNESNTETLFMCNYDIGNFVFDVSKNLKNKHLNNSSTYRGGSYKKVEAEIDIGTFMFYINSCNSIKRKTQKKKIIKEVWEYNTENNTWGI